MPGLSARTGEPCGPTVRDLLLARVERDAAAPALYAADGTSFSYGVLLRHVDAIGSQLRALGVRSDERIALVLPNGIAAATAFLAAVCAGIACPLNAGARRADLAFYFDDLQARTLITDSALDGPAAAVARSRGMRVLDIGDLGATPGAPPPDLPAASSVALILHTSGTTAKPKMVPLTHANLNASAANIATWLALSPHDRCLNVMPLFHIHGLVGALLASLSAGASVVCTAGFVAPDFFALVRRHRPTWYTAVPTMHQAILARSASEGAPPPLRFVRSASAALSPSTALALGALFAAPVIEAYGMTEAAHQMCSNPLAPQTQRYGSVGVAAGPDVAILDACGEPVAAGTIGEVAIRGANVMHGYAGDPAANAGAFVRGWLRTGDLGRFDSDGFLYLEGRIKEIINRGGEKVSPREIDDVLMNHPAILQAVAFPIPDERLGEDVGAAVVLKPTSRVDERALIRFAAAGLADWKVPRRIVIVAHLPLGSTGKPVRSGLAALLGLGRRDAGALPAPRHAGGSGFEGVLAEIWCDVLNVREVAADADFIALGGDSVLAAQVIARVRQRCARELSIVAFFDRAQLGAMAAAIAEAPAAGVTVLDAADRAPAR